RADDGNDRAHQETRAEMNVHRLSAAGAVILAIAAAGCTSSMNLKTETPAAQAVEQAKAANPLLAEWSGPYGGVPPFDQVEVAHFEPALEAAMAEHMAEIERIVTNPEPATFANTIEALERAGRTLNRVATVYSIWGSTMNSPEFQVVQREMAPRLAAFNDRIMQNEALFRRIEAVWEAAGGEATATERKAATGEVLTPEQQRLVWRYYTDSVRAGAK